MLQNMMKRECLEYSYQRYDNPLVKEIRLLHMHRDNDKKGDCCEVIFVDGSSAIHKLNNSSAYTSQYGVPLSADGSAMYISDWYHGLTAYDTRSGNQLWKMKKPHIRMTHLFSDFGVTVQYGKALLQFDLESGEILNTLNSGQIEDMFYLKDDLVLISRYRGSVCIIDCLSMTVVKKISPAVLNPHECLSLSLDNVYLKDNKVIAVGVESLSRTDAKYKTPHDFSRILCEIADRGMAP